MSVRANKITIRVTPARYQQSMQISATGNFGSTSLSVAPFYEQGQALSPATDAKTYWTAVLVAAQAMVATL